MKFFVTLLLILTPALLSAGQTPTICHNELSALLRTQEKLTIVDIQSKDEFRARNYAASIATGNDPRRLRKIAARLRSTRGKVVVVSASGGDDAEQAVKLLAQGGVAPSRLLLLEGGMTAAAGQASCDCCKTAPAGGLTP